MPRNIEIKARLQAIAAVTQRVAELADQGPTVIAHDDTFFACERGRLKLRTFADGTGQLIFYRRADEQCPKESFYIISPTSTPDSLRETLSLAYGQTGRVRKVRTLYLIGRTRVHLDRVENLGDFLELEVVLADGESPAAGVKEASLLMENIGIAPTQLIGGSYLDLLAAKT